MNRRTSIALAVSGAAIAIVAGFGASAAIAGTPLVFAPWGITPTDGAASTPMPAPSYERNANGQTFGSAAEAPAPQLEPDLIRVVSDQGPEGYVLKSDLDDANGTTAMAGFKTPQDALAWQSERAAAGPISIPVYGPDGTTRIGTFTVEGPGDGKS